MLFGTPRPYSFLATPLVEHGQVADEGASVSSSIGNTLVTEEQRDSDIGSIDSCSSIAISDISEELDVDGVQLSDYCNMNVDDNDIIIDMDSDKNHPVLQ